MRRLCFLFLFWATVLQAKSEVYFSPADNVAEKLIERIDGEEKEVLLAMYCLTHRGIADALVRAHRRGVHVEVVIDPFTLGSRFSVAKMHNAHLDLVVFDPEKAVPPRNGKVAWNGRRRPLMHNKFCVFGKKVVWTGSFNGTYDATQMHRENVVVIDDVDVAKRFEEEFFAIKREVTRPYVEAIGSKPREKNLAIEVLKGQK